MVLEEEQSDVEIVSNLLLRSCCVGADPDRPASIQGAARSLARLPDARSRSWRTCAPCAAWLFHAGWQSGHRSLAASFVVRP